jgi:hypothetical protein
MMNLSRASDINEGFDAVWRADFDRAVALLHNVDAPGCATMRSRVYLRMGLANRAIAEYDRTVTQHLHLRERAEMAVIASAGYRAIGDCASANELWESSERVARELNDPLLDLLRLTVTTVRDFSIGQLDRSREAAERALILADDLRDREAQFVYLFDGNHLRARVLEILSMHAALRDDQQERERLLTDAILTSALVRRRDIYIEVNLLANLATVLALYPAVRSRELVLSRAKAIAWTDHLDGKRTAIKRNLRSNKELFGFSEEIEQFGGRGYPTLALRVCESVDRLLHSNWADRSAFDSELAFATELAQRVYWHETTGEEFESLASLAALVATRQPATARAFMEIYHGKVRTLSGQFLYAWDGRGNAVESFAEATIAKASGDYARALAKYAEAQAFYKAHEMRAHAAFAGLERYTLAQDARDLEAAAEFLRAYPNSAFARRLGRAFERTPDAAPGDFIYLDQGAAA